MTFKDEGEYEQSMRWIWIGFTSILVVGAVHVILNHNVFHRRKDDKTKHDDENGLRIGIVGAGAIGTICGIRLLKNRHHGGLVNSVVLVGRQSLLDGIKGNQNNIIEGNHSDKKQNANCPIFDTYPVGSEHGLTVVTSQQLLEENISSNNNSKQRDNVLSNCNIIIVSVKTSGTDEVGKLLSKVLPVNSNVVIISFQNGTNAAQKLETLLNTTHPMIKVYKAVVAFSADWRIIPRPSSTSSSSSSSVSTGNIENFRPSESFHSFHVNVPGGCILEEPSYQRNNDNDNYHHQRLVRHLVRELNRGGLKSKTTRYIMLVQYVKRLFNMINPVNALAGITVPQMLSQYGYRKAIAAAVEETLIVWKYHNIPGGSHIVVQFIGWILVYALTYIPDIIFATMLSSTSKLKDNNHHNNNKRDEDETSSLPNAGGMEYKSSMLQDLERRRLQTEIQDLCGDIVSLASSSSSAAAAAAATKTATTTNTSKDNATSSSTTTATTVSLIHNKVPVTSGLLHLVQDAAQKQQGSPMLSADELIQQLGL